MVRFHASGPAFIFVRTGGTVNMEGKFSVAAGSGGQQPQWTLLGFCERSPVMEFQSQEVGVLSSVGGVEIPSVYAVSTGDGILSCTLTRFNDTVLGSIVIGQASADVYSLIGYDIPALSVALVYPNYETDKTKHRFADVFPLCWPEEIVEEDMGASLYKVTVTFRVMRYHAADLNTASPFVTDVKQFGSLSIGDAQFDSSLLLGLTVPSLPLSI